MSGDTFVRTLLEVLIVVAVGGMLFSSVRRLRAGALPVYRCPSCARPTTRANGVCKHCGVELPDGPR